MADNKNNKQMVGGQIPDSLFQAINLYSISHEVGKSQLIREALSLWIEQTNLDINELTQQLKWEYQAEWSRIKSKVSGTKNEYIIEKKEMLLKQRVSQEIIDKIFKDF